MFYKFYDYIDKCFSALEKIPNKKLELPIYNFTFFDIEYKKRY